MKNSIFFPVILSFFLISCAHQPPSKIDAVASLYSKSIVIPNISYLIIDSIDLKLDAYIPAKNLGGAPWVEYSADRKPVLMYIHGGGWGGLNRSVRNLNFLPYIDKGWAVVNIDYRLLGQAPFPACIADCRYALNWIYENADKYKFDTTKIVVSGESAGGHLALMTGFLTNDREISIPNKPITRELKTAAVINWFGVSDVERLLDFWNSKSFTETLVGDTTKKEEIFKSCSPLTYVNSSTVPVLTIHGDADNSVPFIHATLLHESLDKYGVKNNLIVMKGKKHGDFDEKEMSENFSAIWKFLEEIGIK
ncbi:MAG: alpha/beta hydrolase [Bacteroidota bacterium]|nr:alpha/beta hydrolase [Bacteroidota bacterium]